MRSKLFVPGSRPELVAQALAGEADALSFDLEDSVAPARKAEARDALRAFLSSGVLAISGKTIIVRINAPDTPFFADDIRAMVHPAPAGSLVTSPVSKRGGNVRNDDPSVLEPE